MVPSNLPELLITLQQAIILLPQKTVMVVLVLHNLLLVLPQPALVPEPQVHYLQQLNQSFKQIVQYPVAMMRKQLKTKLIFLWNVLSLPRRQA
jgi:hypothetical protein